MSPLLVIGIALLAAGVSARGVPSLARRLATALGGMREVRPAEAGIPYRSQVVLTPDPRTPRRLAFAAQAMLWLAVLGLLRVVALPLDVVNLLDEPHRRVGLVPDDASLVVLHIALGALAMAASGAALLGRQAILDLTAAPSREALSKMAAVQRASLSFVLAGAVAMTACLGLIARTPMGLYWLDWMALQSALYAVACGLMAALVGAAASSARVWSRQPL